MALSNLSNSRIGLISPVVDVEGRDELLMISTFSRLGTLSLSSRSSSPKNQFWLSDILASGADKTLPQA